MIRRGCGLTWKVSGSGNQPGWGRYPRFPPIMWGCPNWLGTGLQIRMYVGSSPIPHSNV